MMQVKMLRNARGSEDGFTVRYYEQDQNYEVKTSLGSAFVRNGDAVRTGGDEVEAVEMGMDAVQAAAPVGQKSVSGAPENRGLGAAPSNKKAGKKPADATYEAGKLYEVDGAVFLAAAPSPGAEVGLLPVDQLPEGERKALVDEGKLTADGKIAA